MRSRLRYCVVACTAMPEMRAGSIGDSLKNSPAVTAVYINIESRDKTSRGRCKTCIKLRDMDDERRGIEGGGGGAEV